MAAHVYTFDVIKCTPSPEDALPRKPTVAETSKVSFYERTLTPILEDPNEPALPHKLFELPDDLECCERVIKRTRLPLAQRVLNQDIRKGDDVLASGVTHMKMTLISLEDAQRSREVVYHSVEHLDNGREFGRGFRIDLISLREARARSEIKYRTIFNLKF